MGNIDPHAAQEIVGKANSLGCENEQMHDCCPQCDLAAILNRRGP